MGETLQLYVKNTSNCAGLPLQTFELLGPTWTGDSIAIPFVDAGGDDGIGDGPDDTVVMCEVTGWTDLFSGRPCAVHVARARWLPQPTAAARRVSGGPDEATDGYLIWGGNSGLRITGPGAYEDGFGMPIMFLDLDGKQFIPPAVLEVVDGEVTP